MKLQTVLVAAALFLPVLLNAQNTGSLSVKANPGRAGVSSTASIWDRPQTSEALARTPWPRATTS